MTAEEKLLLALLGAMAPKKKKTFSDHIDTVVDKCEDAITSIPDKCSDVANKVEDAVDNIIDFFTI